MTNFTTETLPTAIKQLFELNHYTVEGPLKIHGAEIDLVARSATDPFAPSIYIEATIEYVDNTKYGKDATKFILIREKDPAATCLIVSATGFTAPVLERAKASRIQTMTYDALFARFERFDGYVGKILGKSDFAGELRALDAIYEEADLHDSLGTQRATTFLREWRDSESSAKRWLILVGEYGTGKTALSKILLRRWTMEYRTNPSLPIPFRIELRNFVRQFDARGLLHWFLDHNGLGDLSLEFVLSLIRAGRIVLILDGYDEMAQYLHARERRACLEALAELSADGGNCQRV